MSNPILFPFENDRVLELHRLAIKNDGGDPGIRDRNCIERSIAGALSSSYYYDYEETEPNPIVIGSYLLRNFLKNHCFVDGNKRVGWMVLIEYLYHSGVTIDEDQDEAVKFVESIVIDDLGIPQIVHWIADRLVEPR